MMNDPEILNKALSLALEFGPDWLKPVQERLSIFFPKLNKTELDQCETTSRKAREDSLKFFNQQLKKIKPASVSDQQQLLAIQTKSDISEKYPWINEENLNHLVSQAFYYSMK